MFRIFFFLVLFLFFLCILTKHSISMWPENHVIVPPELPKGKKKNWTSSAGFSPWCFGLVMLSFPIGDTTVAKAAFRNMITNFREFSRPWIQRDKITVILRASLSFLLMSLHILWYLMEGFVNFCNSPFNWFDNVWNSVLHVINNLREQIKNTKLLNRDETTTKHSKVVTKNQRTAVSTKSGREELSHNFTTTKDHITNTLWKVKTFFSLIMPSNAHCCCSFRVFNFLRIWRCSQRCIISHYSYITNTSFSSLVRYCREDIKMHHSGNPHLFHRFDIRTSNNNSPLKLSEIKLNINDQSWLK